MTVVAAPASPYKGLAPFDDSDADALLFFGRDRDSQIIAANLAGTLAAQRRMLRGDLGLCNSGGQETLVHRRAVEHRKFARHINRVVKIVDD